MVCAAPRGQAGVARPQRRFVNYANSLCGVGGAAFGHTQSIAQLLGAARI
jgi:hypothetical protein